MLVIVKTRRALGIGQAVIGRRRVVVKFYQRREPVLRLRRKRTTAFSISRLAIPLPPLLPSVNQIGVDSYEMIAGTIARTKPRGHRAGRVLLWVIAARRFIMFTIGQPQT